MNQSIFNLALDFFRSPGTHDELVDPASPLPSDISSLLDAITREQDPSIGNTAVVSEEMRSAIAFLIERSFFVEGADFYRLLGLNRDASGEQIKKHYNQLMQVFLLSGGGQSGAWNTDHAIKINRAYSVLRDPDRRRTYDQQLQRQTGGREKAVPAYTGKSEKISYFPGQGEPVQMYAPGSSIGSVNRESSVPRDTRLPYVAHSIDRVSSVPASPSVDLEEIVLTQIGNQSPVSAESWSISEGGERSEAYPKAIPMPEPSRPRHSPIKTFFKRILAVAFLAAVLVALAVYLLGTPPVLTGETPEEPSAIGNAVEMQTGSVARNDGTETASDAGSDIPDMVEGVLPGTGSLIGALAGGQMPSETVLPGGVSQGEAGVDAPAYSQTGSPPVGGPAESVPKITQATPGKGDVGKNMASQARIASLAPVKVDKPASPDLSPAKRLEAMRPPEPQNKIAANVPSVAAEMSGVAGGGSKPTSSASAADARSVESKSAGTLAETTRLDSAIEAESNTTQVAGSSIGMDLLAVPPSVSDVPVEVIQPTPSSTVVDDGLRGELDTLLTRFSQAYEAGALPQLLALFSADAKTNDQGDIKGIEKDYRELFSQTDRRAFVFERVQWKKGGDNAFVGQGVFHVYVKLKDQAGSNTLDGRITFNVQKRPQGLLITRMVHDYE